MVVSLSATAWTLTGFSPSKEKGQGQFLIDPNQLVVIKRRPEEAALQTAFATVK